MTGKTHLIGGAMAALGMITASKGMSYGDMATCFACCELGSLLPDIDTTSKITEEDITFKGISLGLQSLGVKHRGATHTIWASALFGVLFFFLAKIMLSFANSSQAFLIACVVFLFIHADNSAYEIKKFGSVLAIAVYFLIPIVISRLPSNPLDALPSVQINISALMVGLSVFFGCISHLVYDSFNPQNILWLHPFSQKRIGVPFVNITTSSGMETIFAGVMSAICVVWVYMLYKAGYFPAPF